MTTVHATAPTRIDFVGGWTDVTDYCDKEGGAVVNAAIDLRVHVEFLLGARGRTIRLHAEDLGDHITIKSSDALVYDGQLDLHKAALNMMPVTGGIEVISRSDAPGGSGLGASGALDVALLAGLAQMRNDRYDPEELAEMGFQLETQELGLLGGRQDQYAAALGGFSQFRFGAEGVEIRRLSVGEDAARDLERHMVLAYTGHSHFSSATHANVWARYADGEPSVTEALDTIRELAEPAAQSLEASEWKRLAALVDRNWAAQKALDATISTAGTQAIEDAARAAGAWGLKATGAGAGGCLVILCDAGDRDAVAEAVEAAGASVLKAGFAFEGVTVWEEEDAPQA
jgi:D-glycero-alpha-D-manno-heptose-7-phosphate kinase